MATAYFIALVVGLVLAVASRVVFWGVLRQARRLRTEPRIGVLAPALFVFTVSLALVLVGVLGTLHEALTGQRLPVPLDVIWAVLALGLIALLVSRQRSRSRRRRVRQQRSTGADDD